MNAETQEWCFRQWQQLGFEDGLANKPNFPSFTERERFMAYYHGWVQGRETAEGLQELQAW